MARRGRPRTPTMILRMRGSRSANLSDRENEPQPDPKIPTPPNWISSAAKIEWRRITKVCGGLGILTDLDRAALASYCQAYADYADITLRLQSEEIVLQRVRDKAHYKNPLVSAGHDAFMRLLRAQVELGFTPAARSRVRSVTTSKDTGGKKRFFKSNGSG